MLPAAVRPALFSEVWKVKQAILMSVAAAERQNVGWVCSRCWRGDVTSDVLLWTLEYRLLYFNLILCKGLIISEKVMRFRSSAWLRWVAYLLGFYLCL